LGAYGGFETQGTAMLICATAGSQAANTASGGLPLGGVHLTRKECALLRLLMDNAGRCVRRDVLLQQVWGYQASTRTRTLDVHIQRLRKKLGPAAVQILTVVRSGYMWRKDGDPGPA